MKQALLIFLATVAASQALSLWPSGTKPSLKVRFGLTDSFIEMPLTVSEAISKKWSLTPRPANSPLPALALWCHESYLACVLYDDTDYISGFQEAFPVARYTDSKFDWKVRGFTKWTPIETGTEYYTAQIYFVDEAYLAKSKEERISERKAAGSKSILQLDGVWVTGINGELFKISKDYEGIKNSIFTKQACIPGMGRHFYYNMTREAECTSESMFAWFPLVHSGRLVAVGLTTFGKLPENGFDIFERPPTLAVKAIVPRGPQCLYDLADNPGLVTSHIYFDVGSPLTELTCILQ